MDMEAKNIARGLGEWIGLLNSLAFGPSKICSYAKPTEAKHNKRKISTESH